MIECDRGDEGELGFHEPRGVQTPAQPCLDHQAIHPRPLKADQGRECEDLEERERTRQVAALVGQDAIDRTPERGIIDRMARDPHPLAHPMQMWAGVEANPPPPSTQEMLGHGGHRALPIRADDVDRPDACTRPPQGRIDALDQLEARSNAQGPSGKKGRVIGHAVAFALLGASRRSISPSCSRSSRRLMILSTIPCSRTNSER